MNATLHHPITARSVQFDLSNSPLQWIPNDPLSSHVLNGLNMLLPAGEFWFCRVFNKALPLITDPVLLDDVKGFVRQEATHARAHLKGQEFLQGHGVDTEQVTQLMDKLFSQILGDAPLGIERLKFKAVEKHWLVLRVGIIATIEHFTGVLGQWALDSKSWDIADPVVADMFRWHLAEEVEHRSVAFDLFEHLCKSELGFYLSRQALMAWIYPLFIYIIGASTRYIARQDSDPASLKIGNYSVFRGLIEFERVGRKTDNVPTMTFITAAMLRWTSPRFNPEDEGNTQQALDYFAKSPAVQAFKAH